MRGGSLTLGRILGIPVRVHASLLLVVGFVAAAFSREFALLGAKHPLLLPPLGWGLVVAAALFASVLLHELAHSFVALRAGGSVSAITLMFIGGVSEIAGPAPRPRLEAVMLARIFATKSRIIRVSSHR